MEYVHSPTSVMVFFLLFLSSFHSLPILMILGSLLYFFSRKNLVFATSCFSEF